MNRTFRYMTWTFEQDATTYPEYSAVCVTGEEKDCGEMIRSGGAEWVEEWMRRHTQDTGHTRYRRNFGDYVTLEPPGGVRVVSGEVIQPRALPTGGDAA